MSRKTRSAQHTAEPVRVGEFECNCSRHGTLEPWSGDHALYTTHIESLTGKERLKDRETSVNMDKNKTKMNAAGIMWLGGGGQLHRGAKHPAQRKKVCRWCYRQAAILGDCETGFANHRPGPLGLPMGPLRMIVDRIGSWVEPGGQQPFLAAISLARACRGLRTVVFGRADMWRRLAVVAHAELAPKAGATLGPAAPTAVSRLGAARFVAGAVALAKQRIGPRAHANKAAPCDIHNELALRGGQHGACPQHDDCRHGSTCGGGGGGGGGTTSLWRASCPACLGHSWPGPPAKPGTNSGFWPAAHPPHDSCAAGWLSTYRQGSDTLCGVGPPAGLGYIAVLWSPPRTNPVGGHHPNTGLKTVTVDTGLGAPPSKGGGGLACIVPPPGLAPPPPLTVVVR